VAENLAELGEGESGILESLELPEEIAHRLMELGFLPAPPWWPADPPPEVIRGCTGWMGVRSPFAPRRRGIFS
jgi:hypothetical protein